MVVWQFATIAALIGALLIYVMVLTNRLATTNVLLKRIEEGLVRPQPVTENLPARAVEVVRARPVAVPRTAAEQTAVDAPVAAPTPATAPAAEMEDAVAAEAERDRRVSYLTVRDLKVIARSGRRSSDIPVGVSPLFNELFGRQHAQTELAEQPELAEQSAEQPVPHLEIVATDEPMFADVESHAAVVEELAVATHEMQDFLQTTPAPEAPVVEQEPVAVEIVTPEPVAVEAVSREPVAVEAVAPEPVTVEAFIPEPVAIESATSEPAAAESVATIPVPAIPAPAAIAAANEDQAPAEAPAPAAAQSQPDDAAAREEKRKRDLLMHAYRRRRAR